MKGSNIYNVMGILCVCSAANEAAKYVNIRSLDPEKTVRYDEFSENYKILIKNYVKGIGVKRVFSSVFGLNFDSLNINFFRTTFNRKINEKFNEQFILSKFI